MLEPVNDMFCPMTDPLTPESSPILLQNIYNKAYLAAYSPNMLAYPIYIKKIVAKWRHMTI